MNTVWQRCEGCRRSKPVRAFCPTDWQGSYDVLTDQCRDCTEWARRYRSGQLAQYFAHEVRVGRLVGA